jgi:type IV pilus assembly protein PilA
MTRSSKLTLVIASLMLCQCGDKKSPAAASTTSSDAAPTKSSAKPSASSPHAASSEKPPASSGKLGWEDAKPCDETGVDYLSATKTSEAKNALGAIVRGAQASYEREQMPTELLGDGEVGTQLTHALCKSSTAVPVDVISGKKYQPDETPGKDFDTGDRNTAGWKCLRFSMSDPIYYQYKYTQGSGYVGPARGLPDPGPDGFEASATGDLDGNGKTSLFTIVGVVNKTTRTVKVSTSLYCADPGE